MLLEEKILSILVFYFVIFSPQNTTGLDPRLDGKILTAVIIDISQ